MAWCIIMEDDLSTVMHIKSQKENSSLEPRTFLLTSVESIWMVYSSNCVDISLVAGNKCSTMDISTAFLVQGGSPSIHPSATGIIRSLIEANLSTAVYKDSKQREEITVENSLRTPLGHIWRISSSSEDSSSGLLAQGGSPSSH